MKGMVKKAMDGHTIEYYTIARMKELDLHVAMWAKPENTMLGEKSKEHCDTFM